MVHRAGKLGSVLQSLPRHAVRVGVPTVDYVHPADRQATLEARAETKRKPGLRPREPAPPATPRTALANSASCARALFEELSASGRNQSTTEHEDLQEVGADARRAKSPSAASVTRRGRISARPSRAARKVRARSSARGRADRRPQGAALSSSARAPSSVRSPVVSRGPPPPFARRAAGPSTNKGEAAGEARWVGAKIERALTRLEELVASPAGAGGLKMCPAMRRRFRESAKRLPIPRDKSRGTRALGKPALRAG